MILQENISLHKHNTFGIEASARYFLEVGSVADVQNYLGDRKLHAHPLLVLGGGSNILFTQDFNGVVVRNRIKGIELIKEDKDHYYVKAGAGEVWHEFVMYCIGKNYAGVENLSLIPGSVGAAPIQNIGAYGVEQKEVFFELEALDVQSNKVVTLNAADCCFGYRDSIFKNEAKGKLIITSVTFRLFKSPKLNTSYGAIGQELEKMGVKEISISAISQAVCNIRRSKLPDPEKIGNAGSFFKNPVVPVGKYESLKKEFPGLVAYTNSEKEMKLAAGWLVEQSGWKGKRSGLCGVHKDQALVLVNYGGASGRDVYELSEQILRSVKIKFGVTLEREVVIM